MTRIPPPGGAGSPDRAPLHQPKFDPRIQNLRIPGEFGGQIWRGFMVWNQKIPGYSHRCVFRYLFNPTTVEASYSVQDAGVQASLLFPNANDQADLTIPVNQSVNWSLLFDRTYELWGSYAADGTPRYKNYAAGNNPQVVGVWADVLQLMEFTGMLTSYVVGTSPIPNPVGTGAPGSSQTLAGHQGIMMMIPAWAFFGRQDNLHYYGYISAWDVTYTHWSQFMVPMRAAVDITFNLLPPPSKQTNLNWVSANGGWNTSSATNRKSGR